ncbi:purine-nucleoside phosphorylase [Campylobacter sp. LR185c]|uniref:phosphorylase family protein n=1 Tax=Campylobacter sp. LR185c TaxID=2014525 RepID=UPI001237B3F9|nr:purine-nucleoside phosphorylase [Campylobacter sp. LR185c]KAA6227714.1 purine-nucleoside phosphorylase [Campylobacter sp. LR185c]KAA8603417.1 purine-nucleoside phosphorylase [Campylobacter sp. LR185c]
MLICAGANEEFEFAKSIGVGLIDSSINLTQLCLELKPKKLIFIGTCGLYDNNNKLLEIYTSTHAFNIEFSMLNANFYTPISNEIKNVSCETKKSYKVNSSNYICQNKNASIEFAKIGLELENMEAFAVLKVAQKFKLPTICYLCATNFCDENAHKTFLQNHKKAKEKLEIFLKDKNLI